MEFYKELEYTWEISLKARGYSLEQVDNGITRGIKEADGTIEDVEYIYLLDFQPGYPQPRTYYLREEVDVEDRVREFFEFPTVYSSYFPGSVHSIISYTYTDYFLSLATVTKPKHMRGTKVITRHRTEQERSQSTESSVRIEWKCSISVKMFRVRLRLRFCRRQSTDYPQFGDRETLTISMWSTNGAGGTGGNDGLLTQMERCN